MRHDCCAKQRLDEAHCRTREPGEPRLELSDESLANKCARLLEMFVSRVRATLDKIDFALSLAAP